MARYLAMEIETLIGGRPTTIQDNWNYHPHWRWQLDNPHPSLMINILRLTGAVMFTFGGAEVCTSIF